MTDKESRILTNIITIFNRILDYQKSNKVIKNYTETIKNIMYRYNGNGYISAAYADCSPVYILYNRKNKLREIMDYTGEFSLFLIYNENDEISRAFITNSFRKRSMPVIGNKEDIIIQVNPFYRQFYVFDTNRTLIDVYKETDGLIPVSKEKLQTIKDNININNYFK